MFFYIKLHYFHENIFITLAKYQYAKLIAGDIKVSEEYNKAKDTIVICILNDNVLKRNAYLSLAMLKYEETEEIAKKMKEKGLSIELIQEITNLSLEEIKSL